MCGCVRACVCVSVDPRMFVGAHAVVGGCMRLHAVARMRVLTVARDAIERSPALSASHSDLFVCERVCERVYARARSCLCVCVRNRQGGTRVYAQRR